MDIRFGYVAMSENLQNASPSQTMTVKQFEMIKEREHGLRRLERIAMSNLDNCLRLLKHNLAHDILFFRFSSRVVPLVNHPLTEGWKYEKAISPKLTEVGDFIAKHNMRVDFHPDHFVILNNQDETILQRSLQTLLYHYKLLKGMGIDPRHRCVLHIGGKKYGKFQGLETFIDNFEKIPSKLQEMIMIENDDTIYHVGDALYLGEKLGIPVVLDLHHHDLNHPEEPLSELWERVLMTWSKSPLPIKIHISSPKEGEADKRHHDFIDADRLSQFLQMVAGTCERLDVMIEAKKKDQALFHLMEQLRQNEAFDWISEASLKLIPSTTLS